ncbi:hypothetical protein DEO72_LG3g723 [Vigna unguiculata]|uniref:Uncharacterized protein n=1 Tax=Vigna unguiculata TaxID=3917 RepID=A0A4D6LCA6_VIGUN|nr:hypothetical protein DEO72_LG3g723 [Vigna unguiculata]
MVNIAKRTTQKSTKNLIKMQNNNPNVKKIYKTKKIEGNAFSTYPRENWRRDDGWKWGRRRNRLVGAMARSNDNVCRSTMVAVVDGDVVVRQSVVEFTIGVAVRVLFGGGATTSDISLVDDGTIGDRVRLSSRRWQWW